MITIKLNNMKTKVLNLAKLFIAAVAITSCNNSEELIPSKEKHVEFNMSASSLSRTATTETGGSLTTTFIANDEVGVYVYEAETNEPILKNIKCTFNGTHWNTAQPIKISPEKSYKFYAYYPYNKNLGSASDIESINLSVKSIQKDEYDTSDILISKSEYPAYTGENKEKATVNLSFEHAFSMIEIELSGDAGKLSNPIVKLVNVANSEYINLETKEITLTDKKDTEIIMNKQGEMNLYRAILPAQEIAENTEFLRITGENEEYKISTKSNSGNKFTLNQGQIVKIGISTLPK